MDDVFGWILASEEEESSPLGRPFQLVILLYYHFLRRLVKWANKLILQCGRQLQSCLSWLIQQLQIPGVVGQITEMPTFFAYRIVSVAVPKLVPTR